MILGVVRWIYTPVAIAFLLYFVWDGRESLLETFGSGDALQLPVAALSWSLLHLLAPLLPTVIFRARGHPLSYQTAADIHVANLPARYVPGGIWHTVGRIAAFKRLGIGRHNIAVFVFLENVLAVGVAFVIGGFLVAWYQGMEGWGLVAACASAGGLALLLASPFILSHRLVKGDRRFGLRDYLASIAVVVLSCCSAAAAFVIYVAAFPELDFPISPIETGAVYLFSWGVGFVSVFAPQGIGVFEVVAGELLSGAASLKSTVALLVGFRLVIMVSDSFTWAVQQTLYGVRRLSKEFGR